MNKSIIIAGLLVSLSLAAPLIQEKSDLVKITDKRIPMDERLRRLCIGPEAVVGPHSSAEVDIYVNSIAIKYRRENPTKFSYPVGSKFVKEKYSKIGDKDPDVATIMLKKQNSGTITDWEFSMESLPSHKPITPKGRVSCASCHEHYEERGFISKKSEDELLKFLKRPTKEAEQAAPSNGDKPSK
jgi:hypothetical protein